ncbi:MAG TPA: cell wall-binding repeat-containing protein [Solirubrobacteraceae bacterium]|jgi:hypothetical protein
MRARQLRPLLVALALALAPALIAAGCGKSLPGDAQGRGSTAIAPVNPHGAGGLTTKNTTRLGGADPATDAAAVALAVYPGLAPATRPEAVVVVDEHDWPAALAASALASAPLRAPLLYADGDSLPQTSEQALSAMAPTGAPSLGGAQIVQIATSAGPSRYRSRTLPAAPATDPYAQAAAIERLLSDTHGGSVHQVIVVAADGPPAMAMPAAGLAAQTGAPILFVNARGVPAATRAVLARLHKPSIYAVGSPTALSSAVLGKLKRFGPTKRVVSPVGHIVSSDAVGNSVAVALYTDGAFGWGVDEPGHGLVFLNALRPLDAPAAAPLSANGDYGPLLLLESAYGIPKVLGEYLADIQPAYGDAPAYRPVHGSYNRGWLVGDERAISATTQAEIDARLEIKHVSPGSVATAAPETEPEAPVTSTATASTPALAPSTSTNTPSVTPSTSTTTRHP